MDNVLEVKNLTAAFRIRKQEYEVLHDISFTVKRNETLCVVGESGCGKSVTTLCVMQLLPANGRIVSGSINLDGVDLTKLSKKEMVRQRGKKVGMIFQEPMTSLNPLLTIGFQMREMIMLHRGVGKEEANALAVEYLRKAGISNPESRMKQYTFELSGGLRQKRIVNQLLNNSLFQAVVDGFVVGLVDPGKVFPVFFELFIRDRLAVDFGNTFPAAAAEKKRQKTEKKYKDSFLHRITLRSDGASPETPSL